MNPSTVAFRRSRELQRLYDLIDAGLCTKCREPNTGSTKWICPACRAAVNTAMRAYNRRRNRQRRMEHVRTSG